MKSPSYHCRLKRKSVKYLLQTISTKCYYLDERSPPMLNGLIILCAYLIGSIPSGLWIGKIFYKTDIREHGSGNLGATNTFRILGKKAGLVVTVMDVLKGTAAVLLVTLPVFVDVTIHSLILGLVAVIGHMFPIFANFRGGKAVATSAGVLLGYSLFIHFTIHHFYRNIKAHENCQPHIHDCGTRRINLFDNLLFCDRRLCIRDFSSLFIYLYHLSTPSKYFAH